MIGKEALCGYTGPAYERGESYAYLPPAPRLRSFIPNYTLTCPAAGGMPVDYTILPTASATITCGLGPSGVSPNIRGPNSVAEVVGGHAHSMEMLLLIEFHPGGLFPLLGIDQEELRDISLPLGLVRPVLAKGLREALETAETVEELVAGLDALLLRALADAAFSPQLSGALAHIRGSRGLADIREIAGDAHYSPRHLGRIFHRELGVGIKTFSRIVRVNHAIALLQGARGDLAAVAQQAGYFDQPHFIRDFGLLCGVGPGEYLRRMSVFYNDAYKL